MLQFPEGELEESMTVNNWVTVVLGELLANEGEFVRIVQ